jgi:hypothetical protein
MEIIYMDMTVDIKTHKWCVRCFSLCVVTVYSLKHVVTAVFSLDTRAV